MNPAMLALLAARGAKSGGVTFHGVITDTSDSTVYALPGVDIGPADTTRTVVVGINGRSLAPTSVTIGGVAATLDATQAACWIYRAVVPTGTAATIQITSSTEGLGVIVGVWSIVGYTVAVGHAEATNAPNKTLSMTTTAGGALIAVAYVATTDTTTTLSGVGEDYDLYSPGSGITAAGGHAYPTSGGITDVSASPSIRLAAVAYTLT